ncbi:MAG: response regulator transcription factor [Candidatus Omnitrophica bacterium]|nr:response regulator transcription factor [Candidatus Omnitrophota bacterium]
MPARKEAKSNGNEKKKVYLVDDHPLYREGLAQFINCEKDLEVCGFAEKVDHAIADIEKVRPDLIILDLTLKDSHGMDLIKWLRAQGDGTPILVLSMHDESLFAERVLRAGARGYIAKESAREHVMTAIRRVLDGKIYLSNTMTEKMLEKQSGASFEETSPINTLSDREIEVFQSIGEGLSTSAIAKNLHLSVKTVETYRANIKSKLNLKDNMELIRHAVQWVQSGHKI